MVHKPPWNISDFDFASYTSGCVEMFDLATNNWHLRGVWISSSCSKKMAAETLQELQNDYVGSSKGKDFRWLVPSPQTWWFRCWRLFAWRKAKNLQKCWSRGIDHWKYVENAKTPCFSIWSYLPNLFRVICMHWKWFKERERAPHDLKLRDVERPILPCGQVLQRQKEGFFMASTQVMESDFITETQRQKIMETDSSWFYVVWSSGDSRCKGFEVYLRVPERWYLVWAFETKWNHHWRTVFFSVNMIDPRTEQKPCTLRPEARQSDSTAWQCLASHFLTR